MDSFEDVDVCFDENPYKHFLLANVKIDSEHLKYKRYRTLKTPPKTTFKD